MIPAAIPFERRIPPRGPLLLRGPGGEVPLGYAAFGPDWALAVPGDLAAEGVAVRDGRLVLTRPDSSGGDRTARVLSFWNDTVPALLPDPFHIPPVSAAGLVERASLAAPLEDEAGRAAPLRAYLDARAGRGTPAGVPAAIDRVMRMLSVLALPAEAKAVLAGGPGARWSLRFEEGRPLQPLFDRLAVVAPAGSDAKGPSFTLVRRLPANCWPWPVPFSLPGSSSPAVRRCWRWSSAIRVWTPAVCG